MLSNFQLITITHHKLNVNELEKFVVIHDNQEQLTSTLNTVKETLQIEELLYMATCNRVQLLCFTEETVNFQLAKEIFNIINPNLKEEDFFQYEKFIDIYTGEEAIKHIFSVSSSIDSLVVGEREILRQYRQAYDLCQKNALTGDNMRLVDKYTVQAAKDVYANTKIGEKPVSIVSLAIQKLLQFDLPRDARLLLIGAGETNNLVGKFLKKHTFSNVTIFNRSLDNAKGLSEMLNAQAYHLSELEEYKGGFDCIISCTGSPNVLVNNENYTKLLNGEEGHKILIDLAVPNNVEKSLVDEFDISLIDIEDLRNLANENLAFRKEEVVVAKKILRTHVKKFTKIYQQRQIEKSLTDVPKMVKDVKVRALEKVYKKEIESLDPAAQKLIGEMMDYMEKKCVSIPMKVAKSMVDPE